MNEFSLFINSPVVIYTVLGIYGVFMLFLVAYVRAKFNKAAGLLSALKMDWDTADHRHSHFLDQAHEQLSRINTPTPPARAAAVNHQVVNRDMRNQVVTMGKKGMATSDIARSCGLPEGEVDVLLGLARMQVTSR